MSIPDAGHGGQHNEVPQNFTVAILDSAQLLAPAPQGIHSVELADSLLFSAWTPKILHAPIDGKEHARMLNAKIAESAQKDKKKKAIEAAHMDFSKSFAK